MENSKFFDEAYKICLREIKQVDLKEKSEILGSWKKNGFFIFPFFNRELAYDGDDFTDQSGEEVLPAIKLLLAKYIITCPEKISPGSARLLTFREFPGSGPLFSRFVDNTSKIMETTFSGCLAELEKRCRELNGCIVETEGYDLSVRFKALPRIPIILNFNDKEDGMPARAGFLFYDNASSYPDLQTLSIISTYLTGRLIDPKERLK
ncbi:MAG: DUF3786 domain-containing protein [Desulfobacula sp.]|jgi:hypothetical protein